MKLRRATLDDALDILAWRNDALTIAMSHTPGPVDRESHLRWFGQAITDPNRLMLVAIDNDRKLGVVRFDRINDGWLTSINIAPEERGKGYGLRALAEAIRVFRAAVGEHRLLAEIKDNNEASLQLFRQCGFVWQSQQDGFHRLVHLRPAHWSDRMPPLVPARIVAGELQASLVLGSAQFGMAYGVANRAGKPSDEELRIILDLAEQHGISHIDTAAGYGDSEHRIGSALTADSPLGIVTKVPSNLLDGQPTAGEAAQRAQVAIDRSLWLLRRSRLEAVLLHRFEHYQGSEGAVWQTLRALKAEGKVGRIGASIYRPEELLALLQDPDVGLVQIPFNILDQRWLEPDVQRAIAARPDVVLHGRSALLQGLLVVEDPLVWPIADGDLARRCIAGLKDAAAALGRESVIDLCFAYARAQPWLAGIVVGAETAAQMAENIRLFQTPALTPSQAASAATSLPRPLPQQLFNPALWPRR